MSVSTWAAKYVGTPYEDHDCWALARLIYSQELGVEVPAEPISCRRLFAEVPVPESQPFDLALMRAPGGWHVGVVIEPNLILHSKKGTNAVITRLDGRTARYFRHSAGRRPPRA